MKYIVVEDEFIIRQALVIQMKSIFPDSICMGQFDSIANLKMFINLNTPDFLFMDINLPDGCGFKFIKEFREESSQIFPVVFITAYPDFESSVLKMSQTAYLQKPIRKLDISNAIHSLTKHNKL
jgi:two-component system, LytTR family, response regulator